MKNALILHGKPSRERYENPDITKPHDANWLPWLKAELGKKGVSAAIPAFPRPYAPNYELWRQVFEKHEIDEETGIVGHSAGADFALRWLSENKGVSVEKLVLVAPWHDLAGKYGDFSRYNIDSQLAKRIGCISIFSSADDSEPITERVTVIKRAIPKAHLLQLDGFGHFMLGNSMSSVKFPELLEELGRSS